MIERRFVLHEWTVIPERDLFVRSDKVGVVERRVTPLEMKLLVRLSRDAGAVVSKAMLLREVWEGAYVVEHVLPKTLSKLRASLDDDSHHPRFIETVARRGYRLIATPAAAKPDDRLVPRPERPAAWASLVVAAVVILVFAAALLAPTSTGTPPVMIETEVLLKAREQGNRRDVEHLTVPVRIAILPLDDERGNTAVGDGGDETLSFRWHVEIDTGM